MSETSLSDLVKEIGEALLLDDSNHDKAAYKKYVSCIYKIATNLMLTMRLAGGDVVVDSKTSKQVKLVQQCVERVTALLDKMDPSNPKSLGTSVVHQSTVVTVAPGQSVVPPRTTEMELKADMSPPASSSTQISSKVSSGHTVGFIPSEPSSVIENNPYSYSASRSHALTPMEVARKQNQSLMTAYKARMERLNRSDFNAFNYSLTIQRKMAENIAIAHAQEEELARKMQARNLRLEEEASKRFATPIGMSKEEQEQRQIYKRILEYENEAKWLKNWRSKLEASPEDTIVISQLMQEILHCSDHPFTELLHKYQFQIYQRLYPLVANRHEEIDLVKVPLPLCTWPSMDDLAEVCNDNIHSLNSPEAVNFDKGNNKTMMSKIRREDSTEKRDKSLQVLEDAATVDPRKHGPETEVSHLSHPGSEPTSFDLPGGPCSQTENGSLQPAVDSQRQSEQDDAQSENIDPCSSEEPLVELNRSLAVIQGDKHESCDLLNENIDAQSCDQQTETDSREKDHGHVEPVGSSNIFSETSLSDDDRVAKQLTHAMNRQIPNNNKTSITTEDIPAQTINVDPMNTSQQDTFDSNNIDDGASVLENACTGTDACLSVNKDKKELEPQISWERRQAQLLMRQVTQDYNGYRLSESDYDENNLDYLFDDDGSGDEVYSWVSDNDRLKTSLSQDSIPSSQLMLHGQGPSLGPVAGRGPSVDHSISHTPVAGRGLSQTDDAPKFQSLPTNLGPGSKSHQDKEFDKLSQEAYERHLKSISDDIHRYLEKLLVMMTIAYEPLDTPIGKDQCAVSLEEPFFKPIWKTLLRLFRVVNHKQELVLACVMSKHADATLEEFKVNKKLWLTDSVVKPYQSAVSELVNVREHYTMLSKLECVVKVCRLICKCVDDHYSQNDGPLSAASKKAPSVGADDLLPILTYVIVQSAMPQLSSECHAMTEFIQEGYMMGEEGYCLTTLRTALNYVISMFPSLTKSGQAHGAEPHTINMKASLS